MKLASIATVVLLCGGCSRNVVEIPPDSAPPPPSSAAAPAVPATGVEPDLASAHYGAAPTMGGSGDVAGQIVVKPELASKIGAGDVLYIVARSKAGGPPVALKRIQPVALPASFTLSSTDNPMGSTGPLQGRLVIKAKVDKDGDAMTTTTGDLQGVIEVDAGSGDVTLTIDEEVAYE